MIPRELYRFQALGFLQFFLEHHLDEYFFFTDAMFFPQIFFFQEARKSMSIVVDLQLIIFRK